MKTLALILMAVVCMPLHAAPKTYRSVAVGGVIGSVNGNSGWIDLAVRNYRDYLTNATIDVRRSNGKSIAGYPITHSFSPGEEWKQRVEEAAAPAPQTASPGMPASMEGCKDGYVQFVDVGFPCAPPPPTPPPVRSEPRRANLDDLLVTVVVQETTKKKPGLIVAADCLWLEGDKLHTLALMVIPEKRLKKKYGSYGMLYQDALFLAVNVSPGMSTLGLGSNCYHASTGSLLVDLFMPVQCSQYSTKGIPAGGFALVPFQARGLSMVKHVGLRKLKKRGLTVIPMQVMQGQITGFGVDTSITFTEVDAK